MPENIFLMLGLSNFFRIIAFLEGLSYILLLFLAVPIKYVYENPSYVKILGMPHGILFVLYLIIAFVIKQEKNWKTPDFLIILIASVLPFGTFYVDHKYLK